MISGHKVLGLIPARGGSKGIPRKNIKNLAGKPLIAWTIEAARRSEHIDKVIVSTDDQTIADVARQFGAEIPFIRPAELATDAALALDVILHAGGFMEKNDRKYDVIAYLQPTSPLRRASDIDGALELFVEKGAKGVRTIAKSPFPRRFVNTVGEDLNLRNFFEDPDSGKNRQDSPQFYKIHGAVYVVDWGYLKDNKHWSAGETYGYIMPDERSIDIDTPVDFLVAECLMNLGKGEP